MSDEEATREREEVEEPGAICWLAFRGTWRPKWPGSPATAATRERRADDIGSIEAGIRSRIQGRLPGFRASVTIRLRTDRPHLEWTGLVLLQSRGKGNGDTNQVIDYASRLIALIVDDVLTSMLDLGPGESMETEVTAASGSPQPAEQPSLLPSRSASVRMGPALLLGATAASVVASVLALTGFILLLLRTGS
jgi:hypothetical protein